MGVFQRGSASLGVQDFGGPAPAPDAAPAPVKTNTGPSNMWARFALSAASKVENFAKDTAVQTFQAVSKTENMLNPVVHNATNIANKKLNQAKANIPTGVPLSTNQININKGTVNKINQIQTNMSNQFYGYNPNDSMAKKIEKVSGNAIQTGLMVIPFGGKVVDIGGKFLLEKLGTSGITKMAEKAGIQVLNDTNAHISQIADQLAKTGIGKQAVKTLAQDGSSFVTRALKTSAKSGAVMGTFSGAGTMSQGGNVKEVAKSTGEGTAAGVVLGGAGALVKAGINKLPGMVSAANDIRAQAASHANAQQSAKDAFTPSTTKQLATGDIKPTNKQLPAGQTKSKGLPAGSPAEAKPLNGSAAYTKPAANESKVAQLTAQHDKASNQLTTEHDQLLKSIDKMDHVTTQTKVDSYTSTRQLQLDHANELKKTESTAKGGQLQRTNQQYMDQALKEMKSGKGVSGDTYARIKDQAKQDISNKYGNRLDTLNATHEAAIKEAQTPKESGFTVRSKSTTDPVVVKNNRQAMVDQIDAQLKLIEDGKAIMGKQSRKDLFNARQAIASGTNDHLIGKDLKTTVQNVKNANTKTSIVSPKVTKSGGIEASSSGSPRSTVPKPKETTIRQTDPNGKTISVTKQDIADQISQLRMIPREQRTITQQDRIYQGEKALKNFDTIANTTPKKTTLLTKVAPDKMVTDVKAMVNKNKESAKYQGNIEKTADATEGHKIVITQDANKLFKGLKKISKSDMQTLQDYRDKKAAGLPTDPLPSHLQAHDATITELNKSAQAHEAATQILLGHQDKAEAILSRDPTTYVHRIAQNKGDAFDYLLQGDRTNPFSVSRFGHTTAGSKSRVNMAITGENGARSVVHIKGGVVTDAKSGEVLGKIPKLKDQTKVTEYFDPAQRKVLNKTAQDLGINVKRFVKNVRGSGLGGQTLGASFTGADKIHLKAGVPDSVLIHEIGHQIDERHNLQDLFNVKNNKELRALADARNANLSEVPKSRLAYVRKSTEKVAVMFESYLHSPDLFKSLAPDTYKQFTAFLDATPALHGIRDMKPSLTNATNVVKSGEDIIPGTFIGKDGVRYKIGQATQQEITKVTGQGYYVHPVLTSLSNYVETRTALENARFIETLKTAPEFEKFASAPGETASRGWKSVNGFDQFRGWKFDPATYQTLTDIVNSGSSDAKIINTASRFLKQTIVYAPVKHDLNIVAMYAVDRGLSKLLNPMATKRMVSSLTQAFHEVTNQGPLQQEILKRGFSMPSAGKQQLEDTFAKELKSFMSDKNGVEKVANQLGTTAQRIRSMYTATQHTSVWQVQDILNTARIIERMKPTLFSKGMTLDQAVNATSRFSYQYKVPSRVLLPGQAGRSLAQTLKSPVVFFGRFRYDQFRILGNILKDSTFQNGSKQALEAWDKVAVIAVGLGLAMPVVNKGLQIVSHNPNAHLTAPGPLSIPEQITKVATGQTNWRQAATNQLYLSGAIDMGYQVFKNVDSFTGKTISDPNANPAVQLEQTVKWASSQLAPVQKGNSISNTTGSTILNTILGVSGASFPKNSPETNKLNSVIYNTLPHVQADAKAKAQAGDIQGARQTISQYDKLVLSAAKAAIRTSGKPMPPDGVLISRLKANRAWYAPQTSTLQGYQTKKSTTLLQKLAP